MLARYLMRGADVIAFCAADDWRDWNPLTKHLQRRGIVNLKNTWVIGALLAGWGGALMGADVDTAAAEALTKKSGCMICHSVAQK